MASGGLQNYELVDNMIVLKITLRELQSLRANTRLAVDCEGVNLSREGELTIVAVATKEKAYIFDVEVLDKAVFEEGLREILEDTSRQKLMFDFRGDADSLWHQYRVKLSGVLDVQLLEVMYRRSTSRARRKDVENIRVFSHSDCLELYLDDIDAVKTKDVVKHLMRRDAELWKGRPLSKKLLRYCAVDTLKLFKLYNKLKSPARDEERLRLLVASERYADVFREKSVRSFDKYENNNFLPLDIIPDKEIVHKKCNGCKRLLPRDEFSAMQLSSVCPNCKVCRKIKQQTDEQARKKAQEKARKAREKSHSRMERSRGDYFLKEPDVFNHYDDDDDDFNWYNHDEYDDSFDCFDDY